MWASFLELLLVHSVNFGVLYFCFHLSLDLIFLFWFLHWPISCLVACCLFFKFYVYYFWLHWIFVAMRRLSLVVASRGCFLTAMPWLLLWWLLLLVSTGSRVYTTPQLQLVGSRAQTQELWHMGPVVPWWRQPSQMGSWARVAVLQGGFLTRDHQGSPSMLFNLHIFVVFQFSYCDL